MRARGKVSEHRSRTDPRAAPGGPESPAATRSLSARVRTQYLKEFSWLSASSQLSVLASLLTTVLLARTASLPEVGQAVFAQSVASLLFLALDPRFEDAIQRYIPLLRRESELRARALYWRLVRWDLTLGLGVAAAACVLWAADAYPETGLCRPTFLALAIVAEGTAAALGSLQAGFAITGGLTVLGRTSLVATVVAAVGSVFAIVLFGAIGYLAGTIVRAAVQIALFLPYCLRRLGLPATDAPKGSLDHALPNGFVRFVVGTSLSASVSLGAQNGLLAAAGVSGGPELVALLRVAGAPGRMLVSLSSPVAALVFPRLSTLAAAGNRAAVRRLTRNATRVLLPMAVLAVVASVPLMGPVLRAVYGEQYEASAALAILFVVAAAVRVPVIWAKVLPLAVGRPALRVVSVAVESIALAAAAYVIPRLVPGLVAASVGIGVVSVAVAIGLVAFWLWTSRRSDLLRDDER